MIFGVTTEWLVEKRSINLGAFEKPYITSWLLLAALAGRITVFSRFPGRKRFKYPLFLARPRSELISAKDRI